MRTAIKRASNQAGTVYKEFPTLRFEGLNNRELSIHIGDNQAQDLMNVNFDVNGGLQKKNGYVKLNSVAIDANPIKSIFPFYKSDGTKYVIATSGTSIYNITGGVKTAIKTGLTGSGQRFTAATYHDIIYLCNGTDGVMKWDGTTFSTVSGLPFANCKYILLHKNRMYFSGDPLNPSRLWFSDLGAQETVGALSFTDVNTNDGDIIMSIVEHQDSLVIFKQNSLKVLRGTGPQSYAVIDEYLTKGTVSHWTVVSAMGALYYLSRDGVYMFNGKQSILVSDDIKGSVFGLNNNPQWSQQYLGNACAADYKNKYWLSVTEGTGTLTNNRIYIMDYVHRTQLSPHGVWTRYNTLVSCFGLFQDSTTLAVNLFSGDPTNGFIYQQDIGTSDNGAPINNYYQTKDYDYGAPAHYKSYKGLFFFAEQQAQNYAIQINYIQDLGTVSKPINLNLGGSNPSIWGTFKWGDIWGAKPNVAKGTTSVSGASRYLSLKVSDNSTNPYVFLGFILRYNVKRRLT